MQLEDTSGRYLSNSEMKRFKMVCPVCGFHVNLLEFSEHLKAEITICKTLQESELDDLFTKALVRSD